MQNLVKLLREGYEVEVRRADSPWELALSVRLGGQEYGVRPLCEGDGDVLMEFGSSLSAWSKEMFCPYPWDDEKRLLPALREAIEDHLCGRNAAYLIRSGERPVGFFFLWGLNRNETGLAIPELGEAVVDEYQGQGIGSFMLDMLTGLALVTEKDAVELTTDLRNERARSLYESRGYELLGVIRNPLEVDQTKGMGELEGAPRVREEYHMARVFKNREAVLAYLARKREEQNRRL